jgi:hypothetical protein
VTADGATLRDVLDNLEASAFRASAAGSSTRPGRCAGSSTSTSATTTCGSSADWTRRSPTAPGSRSSRRSRAARLLADLVTPGRGSALPRRPSALVGSGSRQTHPRSGADPRPGATVPLVDLLEDDQAGDGVGGDQDAEDPHDPAVLPPVRRLSTSSIRAVAARSGYAPPGGRRT